MNAPLAVKRTESFLPAPTNFDEAWRLASMLADSDLVPKDYRGKPANCAVAMQWGSEIGLHGLQALQNIAAINGRPSIWGDAALALVLASPQCSDVKEWFDGEGDKFTAHCQALRKGKSATLQTFSIADAKTAGLWGKSGPWTTSPKRMLQMRARGFALRDAFPDVLRGLAIAEESQDVPAEKNMGQAEIVATPAAIEGPKPYPADAYEKNLPAWRGLIESGKKTPDQIITMVQSKGALSEEQKAGIRAIEKPLPTPNDEDIAILLNRAEQAAISEVDILKHLGIASFDGLTAGQLESASAFINDPMGA